MLLAEQNEKFEELALEIVIAILTSLLSDIL